MADYCLSPPSHSDGMFTIAICEHVSNWMLLTPCFERDTAVTVVTMDGTVSVSPAGDRPVVSRRRLGRLLRRFGIRGKRGLRLATLNCFNSCTHNRTNPSDSVSVIFGASCPGLLLASQLQLSLIRLLGYPMSIVHCHRGVGPNLGSQLSERTVCI